MTHTWDLYLPVSPLLLNSLKLASHFPLLNSLSQLSYDIFSILIPLDLTFRQGMAWLTNLIHSIVFLYLSFMTKEPLGFLDGSSLLPLLASLPNYHNGLLRMLPTFNFILSLIHPFISLIQYIFIKPFACAKHMAAIKLWQN